MISRTSVCVILSVLGAMSAFADVQDKTATIAKTTVHYKVVIPTNYDANKAYPGVLAFPGGSQTMNIVENMVKRNYQAQAETRGYIVIMPSAPDGVLFFEGSEKIFPEFLTKLLKDYKIQDNKFHIAGVSNGGISAFHVAAQHPEYFLSLTGFPGYLTDANAARIAALGRLCGGIYMHVGELDSGWREDMDEQSKQFRAKGYKVHFSVEKGEQHIIRALQDGGSARLFNQLDEARQACSK
jgi:predicted esterase